MFYRLMDNKHGESAGQGRFIGGEERRETSVAGLAAQCLALPRMAGADVRFGMHTICNIASVAACVPLEDPKLFPCVWHSVAVSYSP